jgi:glutamate racemase
LSKYGELVLGCTHFNYFKDSLRHLLPDNVKLIDGSVGTVNQLARILNIKIKVSKYLDDSNVEYFYSGRQVKSESDRNYLEKLHNRLEKMRGIQ